MSRTSPIIIGGSHRSGTTLLRRLLNGHPAIFCPPEIKFHLDLLGQVDNDPLRHVSLGASIAALHLPEAEWLDEFGRALVRCYERAAQREHKARWASKAPENALNIRHWDRLLQGAFDFVLVIRHPFDIVASMGEAAMNKTVPTTLEGRAEHIRSFVETGLDYCDAHPSRSTIVRYEALATDPASTLAILFERLGETFHPEVVETLAADRHRRGLDDPKSYGRPRIETDNIGRWRRDLDADAVERLNILLEPLLARLGYVGAS